MDERVLEDIGLSHNEAKIYLTLLNLGLSAAGEVAKKSKVHRTNVYDALERLIEKGLVSYIIRFQTKYFEACPPRDLIRFLKDKQEKLAKNIPEMELMSGMGEKKGQAHVFEGIKAWANLHYGLLRYKEPILAFGIPKYTVEKYLKYDVDLWHKKRIEEKVLMKHIYNENAKKRIKYLNSLPYTEAGYLEGGMNSDVTTLVCGEELFLTFWGKPIMIIQIINKKAASTYKEYFNYLWKQVKHTP